MAYIEHYGIDSRFCNAAGLVNSEDFRTLLAANPHLYLFETEYSGIWAEDATFSEVTPPFPENYQPNLFIRDTITNETMWILYDDLAEVEDPSPEFIEILKIMDVHSLKNLNKRIFQTPLHFKDDDPGILAAEYDFTTGEYIL